VTQTQPRPPSPGPTSLDAENEGYKQSLNRRQVQMIAIGGAIGTGLFLGSPSRLHSTGPALLGELPVRRRHRVLPDARARRAGAAPPDVRRVRLRSSSSPPCPA